MHFAPQELGLLEQSLENFLDDFDGFGFSSDDIKTDVNIDNLYEQLNTLYYDIRDAHRCMDAAQYLSTTSFTKRGSKVKVDNANKIKKAKELLNQIGIHISDKDMPIVIDYYNMYFKDDYNTQPQFASTKVRSKYVKAYTNPYFGGNDWQEAEHDVYYDGEYHKLTAYYRALSDEYNVSIVPVYLKKSDELIYRVFLENSEPGIPSKKLEEFETFYDAMDFVDSGELADYMG